MILGSVLCVIWIEGGIFVMQSKSCFLFVGFVCCHNVFLTMASGRMCCVRCTRHVLAVTFGLEKSILLFNFSMLFAMIVNMLCCCFTTVFMCSCTNTAADHSFREGLCPTCACVFKYVIGCTSGMVVMHMIMLIIMQWEY